MTGIRGNRGEAEEAIDEEAEVEDEEKVEKEASFGNPDEWSR
jgi:hypothetical protein